MAWIFPRHRLTQCFKGLFRVAVEIAAQILAIRTLQKFKHDLGARCANDISMSTHPRQPYRCNSIGRPEFSVIEDGMDAIALVGLEQAVKAGHDCLAAAA